jgi:hypothetical protein
MNSTIILNQCRNSEKMSFPEAGNAVNPISGRGRTYPSPSMYPARPAT